MSGESRYAKLNGTPLGEGLVATFTRSAEAKAVCLYGIFNLCVIGPSPTEVAIYFATAAAVSIFASGLCDIFEWGVMGPSKIDKNLIIDKNPQSSSSIEHLKQAAKNWPSFTGFASILSAIFFITAAISVDMALNPNIIRKSNANPESAAFFLSLLMTFPLFGAIRIARGAHAQYKVANGDWAIVERPKQDLS